MPIQLNSRGWRIRPDGAARGRAASAPVALPGLPPEFVPGEGVVAEEVILEPTGPSRPTRGREVAAAAPAIDLEYDVGPEESAALVIRHASGALSFHAPTASTSRGPQSLAHLRFQVPIRPHPTRGALDSAIKAIVVTVGKAAADTAVSIVLPKTIEAMERARWNRLGLQEGWFRISHEALGAKRLHAAVPASGERSLLFIHGTFSDAASAFGPLAGSTFFDRVRHLYGDRIFAFNHFSLCRTPSDNARMLLAKLPASGVSFDVVTHSRGGLILRELVERGAQFKGLEKRLRFGRAVLVAAPNDGTPLATPKRWEDTLGALANLLELLPDNPFTTAPALVAHGIVWLARHAAVDIPGLSAMDGNGELIDTLQGRVDGAAGLEYSALVANYQPDASLRQRLIDAGIDQFFASANDLVVPSEGGWRIGRGAKPVIPASRIGCFGPGGNLDAHIVTHVGFFSRPETVDFLVNALDGREQPLRRVDPLKALPDHRFVRGAAMAAAADTTVPRRRAATAARPAEPAPALEVTVVNGDLTFVREPLILGHYRSSRLTGTELVMDRLLRNELGQALAVGLYPERIGSHQIFVNTHPDYARGTRPRPAAVIIAGLGDEGRLKGPLLVQTVRQAVIAWSQSQYAKQQAEGTVQPPTGGRRTRRRSGPAVHALAATLIGSGGTEIGPGEAARLIVRGVCDANETIREAGVAWPRVDALRLIELYLDRASEAWRALRLELDARQDAFALAPTVATTNGGLLRPADAGYRGADYDFISVQTARDERGQTLLSYTLDTRRARSEVRAQRTQSRLLRDLIATASNDRNSDEQIRRTLFNLLVPIELEAYLAGTGQMVIELDPQTAGVPWELLDTRFDGSTDETPWGVRVTLLRKLKVQRFRETVIDAAADADALVIGEPECSADYPRLPGAREEAQAVAACLTHQLAPESVRLLSSEPLTPGPSARTVLNALFERPWRILHISGHGVPASRQSAGGVVLSNGSFLGAAEIASLRTIPELVFVNCCYLAAGDGATLLNPSARVGQFDRPHFAAGVARALIDVGVRCVVAAGWAVDDRVAKVFAETFYARVLENRPFLEAVGEARRAAWLEDRRGNTWAAYQCYGDPDWRLRPTEPGGTPRTASANATTQAVASLQQLKLLLDQITIQSKSAGSDADGYRVARHEEFLRLEQLFAEHWKGQTAGAICESLAAAAVEVGELERAVRWYERAVTSSDGQASLRAAEQLANVRARFAWEQVDKAVRARDAMNAAASGRSRRSPARQAAVAADRALAAAVQQGPGMVEDSLRLLRQINAVHRTAERMNLVGSAHKRLALINLVGADRDIRPTVARMRKAYDEARALAVRSGDGDPAYGAFNVLLCDVLEAIARGRSQALDPALVAAVRTSADKEDADFWSMVADIELRQYEAVARQRLAAAAAGLERQFAALHDRVTARHKWASVYDTAALVLRSYTRAMTRRGRRSRTARATRERAAADALLARLAGFARVQN